MNTEVVSVYKFIEELMVLYSDGWRDHQRSLVRKGIRLDPYNNLTISSVTTPYSFWTIHTQAKKDFFSSWHGKVVRQNNLEYTLSAVVLLENENEVRLTFELI